MDKVSGLLMTAVLTLPFLASYVVSVLLFWHLKKSNWSVVAIRTSPLYLAAPLSTALLLGLASIFAFPAHVPATLRSVDSALDAFVLAVFAAPLFLPIFSNFVITGLGLKPTLVDAALPLWKRIFFVFTFAASVLALLALVYALIIMRG